MKTSRRNRRYPASCCLKTDIQELQWRMEKAAWQRAESSLCRKLSSNFVRRSTARPAPAPSHRAGRQTASLREQREASSDDAGWYVFHGDGIPAGAYGDWRSGLSETWRADIGRKLSPQEETAHRARVEATRREREAEDAKRKAEAREQAAAIWQAARIASEYHPYLVNKGIKSYGLRLHDGALVIPMRDEAALHGLQFIEADGEKQFLTGSRVSGCYFLIGEPDGALCIAEGYATGASIHEATGTAVAVAFNAGNLTAVARALRTRFPDLRLIICADDDARTPENPGLTKGREAALAVDAWLAVPDFGANRPESATDFNDLHRHAGWRRCALGSRRQCQSNPTSNQRMARGRSRSRLPPS